jgi:hypothetical protein
VGERGAVGVRRAEPADADAIGRLLHDFNREFDDPTPDPPWLAERVRRLMDDDETHWSATSRSSTWCPSGAAGAWGER